MCLLSLQHYFYMENLGFSSYPILFPALFSLLEGVFLSDRNSVKFRFEDSTCCQKIELTYVLSSFQDVVKR